MFKISSNEDKFYNIFVQYGEYIAQTARLFKEFVSDLENAEEKLKEIKEMEVKCDHLLHKIFKELNKTFITPLDREDIYCIGKQLDDIADYLESSACRFVLFNLNEVTDETEVLCDLIIESADKIIEMMQELKIVNKRKNLLPIIVEINRIEEEGDAIFRKAMKKIFSGDVDVLDVVKWKEIYEHLENTLDACEDVANTIEGIVMKHA